MLQQYNPKNENIQVWVGDRLYPRNEAKVSVFDSSVQGGDTVWEGLRVYKNGLLHLDRHLDRMYESAKALHFAHIPTREFVKNAIKQTLEANGMTEDTHIRLTLSRGEKVTSGMDPRLNQKGSCLIILAEWKPLVYDNDSGIKVITSTQRRNGPQFLDSKIHHSNLLNNILAKIQANIAGADAAIMLDERGFVAELNDTNLFMVKDGTLYTPYANACLHGITRGFVLEMAEKHGIAFREKDLSLVEFYNADEVFATGTMGELTPVVAIDGRQIENKADSNLRSQLNNRMHKELETHCEKL
ncbi:MAG: aminotransferase class IV [Ekhidna sp.]|nr:aminotransferase class IV [Ekhidna sp.]MBC6410160.1 aminotransferase class IV [Ekhidna sp.]MBC6427238.1 aminotransferase class IV [Ekhidna sp.]